MAKHVIFLDDDEDLRDIVVRVLESLDVACDAVGTLDELKARLTVDPDGIDVAILDINLGPGRESGIDAYHWLREHGYGGRVAFLTGHARSHPLVVDALRVGDATVHDKPVTLGEFRAMVA